MSQSLTSRLRIGVASLGLALAGLSTASAQESFPAGQDNFANAPDFSLSSGESATNLFVKTEEPNEPGHRANGDKAARRSAWWRWTAPETGFCTVDTRLTAGIGSRISATSLAVYQGASLSSLTRVGGNDFHSVDSFDADKDLSSVTFHAVAGNTYHIAVDAFRTGVVHADATTAILRLRLTPLRKMVRRSTVRVFRGNEIVDVGNLTVTTTATGRLTGKLTTTKKTRSFAGAIGRDGYFSATFEPPIAKPGAVQELPVTLTLDLSGEGHFALYQDNTVTEDDLPEPTVIPAGSTSPLAGYYTAHVSSDDASVGYVAFTVKGNGSIRGTGVAPDGSAFAFSSALHRQDEQPDIFIHAPLHGKKGGLSLLVSTLDTGLLGPGGQRKYSLFGGRGAFVRPASSGAFYPQGIADRTSISGGTYFVPTVAQIRPFGFLNPNGAGRFIVFSAGSEQTANLVENVTLEANGKVTFASAALKPVLKLNPKTGLVTGSVTEPGKKKRTLRGIIAEDENGITLGGLATGTTRTLDFFIEPPL